MTFILIVADKNKVTLPVLGALRLKVAKQLDIIPEGFNFLWITEFPFFEYDEDTDSWLAMHHPVYNAYGRVYSIS